MSENNALQSAELLEDQELTSQEKIQNIRSKVHIWFMEHMFFTPRNEELIEILGNMRWVNDDTLS